LVAQEREKTQDNPSVPHASIRDSQRGKGRANLPAPPEKGLFPSLADLRRDLDSFTSWLGSSLRSFSIGHLLLILFALHLFAMSFPNDGTGSNSNGRVFDEVYYVAASQDLLNLKASNLEHPFFGKIWGALGIRLFGSDFFGWRIFYVIIGVLAVWAFYEVARVFFSKEKALFAASFLGFETLFFIHTSLLLLEGPPILFGLLGFLCYFKKRYYLSALSFGLSIISKEWGTYFVAALFFYHVYATRRISISREALLRHLVFAVILAATVLIPLWAYDLVYKPVINGVLFTNPIQNFEYYYNYHSSLVISAQDAQNTWDHFAWGWILPPCGVILPCVGPLPHGIQPSVYYEITINGYLHPIDWIGIGNLVIWYSIWAIIPLIIGKIVARRASNLDIFIGVWIACTYVPSLILSGIFHRVVYAFYFINVDPGLALGIPMVIAFIAPYDLKVQRFWLFFWLIAALVFFIVFFPIHPLDWINGG
jgi:4-amino-4-deoxy-L-arabinose transferase-like glycosyltransferase